MKCKRFFKPAALVSLLVACSVLLAGCTSDKLPPIQILVGNTYVSEESLTACEESLLSTHPGWQEEETAVGFTSISFGDPETDPYAGANIAKVSAMVTAKEVDVIVCDTENAARFARGEMFVPIEEVLSEEELSQYQDRLLAFEMVNDEGNPTGEFTPSCGISITGDPRFDEIYGEQEYGVFLVSNAEPMENAEEVFKELIGLK